MSVDKLKKPNQAIVITNGEITATQRKAYNIILHKAQKELRENNDKTTFLFSLSNLKKKAGIKAKNNIELKNGIFSLIGMRVETVKENKNNWGAFTLISDVDKNGDLLEIELPKTIRKALILNDYYTTLDLLIIKSLIGKYAVILYEVAVRYEKVRIPKMTVQEFKKITGTDKIKSYNDFSLLRAKVIAPALREINNKTDIKIEYKAEKIGNKYFYLTFSVKKESLQTPNNTIEIYSPEVETLFQLCKSQMKNIKELISKYLTKDNFEIVKSNIIYSNKNSKENYYSYLKKAIIEDYAEEARKKKEQREKKIQETIKKQETTITVETRNETGLKNIEEIRKKLNKG